MQIDAQTGGMSRTANDGTVCPLCGDVQAERRYRTERGEWFGCPVCDLIFVPPWLRLCAEEEKRRYDLHRNDPADPKYRKFLSRLFDPLRERLAAGESGLDYGCGPGPALAHMLREAGFLCEVYDPFYANDSSVLERTYDFVTCTETVEHMHRPADEFDRLVRLVRPGGWIGIMTQRHDDAPVPFERWFYKSDETHVCFYSAATFRRIAVDRGLHLTLLPQGVALLQRCNQDN